MAREAAANAERARNGFRIIITSDRYKGLRSVMQSLISVPFTTLQVSSAKEAATKIESELGNLNNTLKNIEDARSFDELTVRSSLLSLKLNFLNH
jgi:hypothetical protein